MKQYAEFRFALTSTLTILLVVMYSMMAGGCGSSEQMASKWSESRIQIDGNLKEWSDSTVFVDKDGIRWGVMNDDEFLYLCVMSAKPNLGRQIMARGMTVWFDPNGGEKKTMGVRFPIGMFRGGAVPIQEEGEDRDQRGNRVPLMDRQALNEFEFLGPTENDVQMVPRMQGQGVELHLTSTPERFVYELKIPLTSSSKHPYAVESHKGAAIGVGIETNTPGRGNATEGGEGRGAGGGGGGRGGRTGGGGGGGRGGRMAGGMGPGGGRQTGTNVTFSLWGHVQLAEKGR